MSCCGSSHVEVVVVVVLACIVVVDVSVISFGYVELVCGSCVSVISFGKYASAFRGVDGVTVRNVSSRGRVAVVVVVVEVVVVEVVVVMVAVVCRVVVVVVVACGGGRVGV